MAEQDDNFTLTLTGLGHAYPSFVASVVQLRAALAAEREKNAALEAALEAERERREAAEARITELESEVESQDRFEGSEMERADFMVKVAEEWKAKAELWEAKAALADEMWGGDEDGYLDTTGDDMGTLRECCCDCLAAQWGHDVGKRPFPHRADCRLARYQKLTAGGSSEVSGGE